LACVVVAVEPDATTDDAILERWTTGLTRALRATGRVSDAMGRLGPTEFGIIAMGADAAGAVRFAERLVAAVREQAENGEPAPALRVGYDSVANFRDAPMEPMDMLVRATTALRGTHAGGTDWIRAFQERSRLS
jgi:GGDEF domain-containing protein